MHKLLHHRLQSRLLDVRCATLDDAPRFIVARDNNHCHHAGVVARLSRPQLYSFPYFLPTLESLYNLMRVCVFIYCFCV